MKEIAFSIALVAAVGFSAAADVTLVRGGKPVARIVAVGDAGAAAASELALYLERMSGAELGIVSPEQAPTSGAVFVGAVGDFADLPFTVKLGPHAFAREIAPAQPVQVLALAAGADPEADRLVARLHPHGDAHARGERELRVGEHMIEDGASVAH